MRKPIGCLLLTLSMLLFAVALLAALAGCGPQDDGKTCSKSGHVRICTRSTP
jgi:hypothetical protein